MFETNSNKGFKLTFNNGIILSTQFGIGNYCERYMSKWTEDPYGDTKSADAEVAIKDSDGKWLTKQMYAETFGGKLGEDILTYVSIEQWLKIVRWCANYNKEV